MIKDNDSFKTAVNREKTEINKEQIEESQKKSINEISSAEKMLDEKEENKTVARSTVHLKNDVYRINFGEERIEESQGSVKTYDTPYVPTDNNTSIKNDLSGESSVKTYEDNTFSDNKISETTSPQFGQKLQSDSFQDVAKNTRLEQAKQSRQEHSSQQTYQTENNYAENVINQSDDVKNSAIYTDKPLDIDMSDKNKHFVKAENAFSDNRGSETTSPQFGQKLQSDSFQDVAKNTRLEQAKQSRQEHSSQPNYQTESTYAENVINQSDDVKNSALFTDNPIDIDMSDKNRQFVKAENAFSDNRISETTSPQFGQKLQSDSFQDVAKKAVIEQAKQSRQEHSSQPNYQTESNYTENVINQSDDVKNSAIYTDNPLDIDMSDKNKHFVKAENTFSDNRISETTSPQFGQKLQSDSFQDVAKNTRLEQAKQSRQEHSSQPNYQTESNYAENVINQSDDRENSALFTDNPLDIDMSDKNRQFVKAENAFSDNKISETTSPQFGQKLKTDSFQDVTKKAIIEQAKLMKEETLDSGAREEPIINSSVKSEEKPNSSINEEPVNSSVKSEEKPNSSIKEEPVNSSVKSEEKPNSSIKEEPFNSNVKSEEKPNNSIKKEISRSDTKEEPFNSSVKSEEKPNNSIKKEISRSDTKEEPLNSSIKSDEKPNGNTKKEEKPNSNTKKEEALDSGAKEESLNSTKKEKPKRSTEKEINKNADDGTKPKIIKGDRRNKNINKTDISQKAEKFGVKSEAKDILKKSVLEVNNSVKLTINSVSNSAKRGIKASISSAADDDMSLSGIDMAIKTIDNAKYLEKATVNTAKSTYNGIKGLTKAPRKITNTTAKLKSNLKRMQKFTRLSRARKVKIAKSYVKKSAKNIAVKAGEAVVGATKSMAVKIIALIMIFIILIVVAASSVILAIVCFMWDTGTDFDTTQMVKHIATLDVKQQKAWFNEGKTNVEIEKYNNTHDNKTANYYYLLAVDVPPERGVEDNVVDTEAIQCKVTTGLDSNGYARAISYSGFNKTFTSADDMLENYRWTTDDYFTALAYLQVKNENLNFIESILSFIGNRKLKNSINDLFEKTYNQKIVVEYKDEDKTEYSFADPIYSTSYSDKAGETTQEYFFGRKYSVKYLIDNDMVKFDDDDEEKNKEQKERFNYICRYGNVGVAMLKFPLELDDDEKMIDRIVKHYGEQLSLSYEPPEPDDDGNDVYGKVSGKVTEHYANDLKADEGDIIYAPMSGLCKAAQRDGRGFEYSICTSYDGTNFDFTKKGYLVKISCSNASYISSSTPKVVKKGDWLGLVGANFKVNYEIPSSDNDTDNEDIFADCVFPCCTGTAYSQIGQNQYEIPEPEYEHIHIEMYRLPCDFTNASDIEKNCLAPELFFDYGDELDEKYTDAEE